LLFGGLCTFRGLAIDLFKVPDEIRLSLSGNMDIQMMYLIKGEYLTFVHKVPGSCSVGIEDKIYRLTNKGRNFIGRWLLSS
jgi:hypothetical protein